MKYFGAEPAQPVQSEVFNQHEASDRRVHLPHGVARPRHHKLQVKKPVLRQAALKPRRLEEQGLPMWAVPA